MDITYVYILIVIALALLAVSDLAVGVANDAVNFLNSAVGSKVAPMRVILVIASLGVVVGATFSSGMMEAGRVKHHLANSIANPANTVLAVGYCAPSTLGARLLRGEKEVSIHGNRYPVNAEIRKIESYSGHGDYVEMGDYISCQDPAKLQKVFLVHGEYETQLKYQDYLKTRGFQNINIPSVGETFTL